MTNKTDLIEINQIELLPGAALLLILFLEIVALRVPRNPSNYSNYQFPPNAKNK